MPEEMKGDFSQSSPQSAKSLQSMPDPISYRVCRSRKRASEARWRGLRYGYEMNKLIGGRKRAEGCADKKKIKKGLCNAKMHKSLGWRWPLLSASMNLGKV